MAVAMGVAWRSAGSQLQLGSAGKNGGSNPAVTMDVMRASSGKKMAWGAETEKLMDIMVKRFSQKEVREKTGTVRSTLDLLGTGDVGGGVVGSGLDCAVVEEFLGVDPDQPLPSDWEKCLDLKKGELYYVNKSTGARTSEDPRKHQRAAEALIGGVIAPRTPARPAHDFLASKKKETLRKSTSPGPPGEVTTVPRNPPPAMTPLLSFATGKRLWNLQLTDERTNTISINKTATSWNSSPRAPPFPLDNSPSPSIESNLELNLNLSPSRSLPSSSSPRSSRSRSPSPHSFLALTNTQAHTVCTVEMVQDALKFTESMVTEALKRTEKAMGKRHERPTPTRLFKSPSSSTSSDDDDDDDDDDDEDDDDAPRVNCEAECSGAPVALVVGACTWCHQYVMVYKNVSKCPRCEVKLLMRFSSRPSAKRQRA